MSMFFFAVFFEILPKFRYFINFGDCFGKITLNYIRLQPVFIQKNILGQQMLELGCENATVGKNGLSKSLQHLFECRGSDPYMTVIRTLIIRN